MAELPQDGEHAPCGVFGGPRRQRQKGIRAAGGVAVPAYSGYVTKTNRQADLSLASDIEQALVLAYYNGQLQSGASVVVYSDENKSVTVEGEGAAEAMAAVFGANYKDLRLKYDGWGEEVGVLADTEMIGFVKESGFNFGENNNENLSALLEDVEMVTGVFSGAIGNGTVNIKADSSLGKFLTGNGIELSDDNGTEIANATVMYVAGSISDKITSDSTVTDSFANAWANGGTVMPNFTLLGDNYATMSANVAYLEALAKYIDKQDPTAGVVDLLDELKKEDPTDFSGSVIDYVNYFQTEYSDVIANYHKKDEKGNSPAATDAKAFLAYMQGVSASTDSLMANTNLKNDKYYTDGYILNYVVDYMTAGEALGAHGVTKGESVIALFLQETESGIKVVQVPKDY